MIRDIEKEMDEDELEEVVQQADKDGDGEIDFDEFVDLLKARKRLLAVTKQMTMAASTRTSISTGSGLPSTKSTQGHSFPLPPIQGMVPSRRKKVIN